MRPHPSASMAELRLSLSANYLASFCVLSPPPPTILTPLSHFSLFTFPPPAPSDWGPLFSLFYLPPTLLYTPLYSPFSRCNSSVGIDTTSLCATFNSVSELYLDPGFALVQVKWPGRLVPSWSLARQQPMLKLEVEYFWQ